MRLYVWVEPYPVDYGGSCLYVIANSLKQARELALKKCGDAAYGGFQYKTLDKTKVDVTNKKPTRVHKLPHAECYHWSE